MTLNVISYTLFLFSMVLFFPSLIFAPWTAGNPPKRAPGFQASCPQWIQFNGFTLDRYTENIRLAGLRNAMFDQEATTFAAMYAFYISGLSPPEYVILPDKFCYDIIYKRDSNYTFLQLKDDYNTCPNWILSYGFVEYDSVNIGSTSTSNQDNTTYDATKILDTVYNVLYAANQNEEIMKTTSIFAYSYYEYLTRSENQVPIKPSIFCASLGIDYNDTTLKPFVNTYGPNLTCKAWLELYGYNDHVENNTNKANSVILNTKSSNYKKIQHLPRLYARRLRESRITEINSEKYTPFNYCKTYINDDESATYSFNYTHSSFYWDGYA